MITSGGTKSIFIFLQSVLSLILTLHDWVSIAPLTDIEALSKRHSIKQRLVSTIVSSSLVLIPMGFSVFYYPGPFPFAVAVCNVILYAFLTYGARWIAYFFGSSAEHKDRFAYTIIYTDFCRDAVTMSFLISCIVMHIVAWSCFVLSLVSFFCR